LFRNVAWLADSRRFRLPRGLLLLFMCSLASSQLQGQSDPKPLHGIKSVDPPREPTAPLVPLPPPAFSATTHTFWTRRDGAPGSISSLAQTKDGYLWIGSTLGLYRFDGLRFSSYPFGPHSQPLPSLDIASLSADRDGGLWVAFHNTAIVHLKTNGSAVSYGSSSGLVANMLERVIARPDGTVWAFGGGKLFKLEGEKWVDFGKRHGLGRGGVFSVFFDREGTIWIGRDRMLWMLRSGDLQFTQSAASVHYVSSMAQTRDGQLWIGDAWRCVRALSDTSLKGVAHLLGKAQLLLDANDSLWIAQDDEGLSRIQHVSNGSLPRVIEHSGPADLSAPRTNALLEDREGNIWVGTDRGLDRFRPTPFIHFRETELRGFPSLVAGDDGSIWVNSHGSPLMRVANGVTTRFGKDVNTGPLAKRRNGDICFVDATSEELQCYGSNGAATHVPLSKKIDRDPPINMTEDADGSLLISFQEKHLWRYLDNDWEPVTVPGLPAEDPWGILCDSQGRLWLGYRGNSVVERQDGVYKTLKVEGGPWSKTLTFFEGAGTVWIGGSDGLAFLNEGRIRRVHSPEEGLLRGISGIALDKFGNLWLNAGAGALRISADEVSHLLQDPDHSIKLDVFDENDGLVGQPTQFKRTPSAISDNSGTLWFATGGDLVSLDPSKLRQTTALPSVLIENVLVDGKPVLDAPGVAGAVFRTGADRLHDLEIGYIGINLSAPERVYYRYRLVGEDTEWQDAGSRRQAFYTRLRPGTYRFEVSANNGEEWSDLVSPLTLEITPAFYQTWLFKIVCLATVLGFLWLYLWARMKYATEHFRELLAQRIAERERVARDLHDTLLQGFQGLMMRFHLATQSIPQGQNARREMEEAMDCADAILIESRDKIRGLRYENSGEMSMSQALLKLGEELMLQERASFETAINGTPMDLDPMSYDDVYAIAKEALTNARRHSGASVIRAEIGFSQKYFKMRISDDGKGIDTSVLNSRKRANHYGLAGMYERAVALKADLRIANTNGRGAEVVLIVPSVVAYSQRSRRPLSQFIYRYFGFVGPSNRSVRHEPAINSKNHTDNS
jgi:signal transduction histidine kinase/ligand-binding sensor domain-containing protein